jgi:hypothetical protein
VSSSLFRRTAAESTAKEILSGSILVAPLFFATMASDTVRNALWDAMLTADLNVRYWRAEGCRYGRLDTTTKIFLAATSSSTVATWGFWQNLSWLWKALSAISALLAVALPILNWSGKISTISDLHGRWIQIRNEHEALWRTCETTAMNEQQIETAFRIIRQKEADAETSENQLRIARRPKLAQRCYDEVIQSRGIRPPS